ncbi:peptidoglycan-binding protein [Cellulomonas hominis]
MTRRHATALVWVVTVALVATVGFWAGKTFGTPPAGPTAAPSEIAYTASSGEVGQTQNFVAQGSWTRSSTPPSAVSGTVTTVDLPPDGVVSAGLPLLTVNLRPVIAAVGSVPAFRTLKHGTSGPDVTQLQELLRTEGFDAPSTGGFDASTGRAVRAWQKVHGFAVDGVVASGDVLFLPTLPLRLTPAEGIVPGAVVEAGQSLFDQLGDPVVTVTLDATQTATVPQSGDVVLEVDGSRWSGVIGRSTQKDDGSVLLTLTAADGSAICANACGAALPTEGSRNLPVEIVVTPATTGVVVPVSAVRSDASARTSVRLPDGTDVPVEVVASARGLAVVEGIDDGTQVLIPATSDAS